MTTALSKLLPEDDWKRIGRREVAHKIDKDGLVVCWDPSNGTTADGKSIRQAYENLKEKLTNA